MLVEGTSKNFRALYLPKKNKVIRYLWTYNDLSLGPILIHCLLISFQARDVKDVSLRPSAASAGKSTHYQTVVFKDEQDV